jgi:putative FmdB family regulatory protein
LIPARGLAILRSVPLYEYACRACDRAFELLVRAGDTPACPACAATDVARLMSAASVGRGRPDAVPPASPCGSCGDPRGPGACATG